MEMRWQQDKENIHAANRIGLIPELKAMFEQNQPIFGFPSMKQMRYKEVRRHRTTRRFDCRIQVLRTDGGLECRNIHPFCQKSGVARQLTEPKKPTSNGKACITQF
jgi:hypothetical protein